MNTMRPKLYYRRLGHGILIVLAFLFLSAFTEKPSSIKPTQLLASTGAKELRQELLKHLPKSDVDKVSDEQLLDIYQQFQQAQQSDLTQLFKNQNQVFDTTAYYQGLEQRKKALLDQALQTLRNKKQAQVTNLARQVAEKVKRAAVTVKRKNYFKSVDTVLRTSIGSGAMSAVTAGQTWRSQEEERESAFQPSSQVSPGLSRTSLRGIQ